MVQVVVLPVHGEVLVAGVGVGEDVLHGVLGSHLYVALELVPVLVGAHALDVGVEADRLLGARVLQRDGDVDVLDRIGRHYVAGAYALPVVQHLVGHLEADGHPLLEGTCDGDPVAGGYLVAQVILYGVGGGPLLVGETGIVYVGVDEGTVGIGVDGYDGLLC